MALTDASVVSAAAALNDDLSSNGCQAVSNSNVSTFQSAYNAAGGSPQLAVDGLYGANTSGALQATFAANPGATIGSYTAPAGCVTQGGGGSLPPVVVPSGGSSTVPESALPWVLGGLVLVAGAFAAYTYSKKHHRR